MEAEHKESLHYQNNLSNTLSQINEQITLIDTHSLALIDGFLANIDVSLTNEPYS